MADNKPNASDSTGSAPAEEKKPAPKTITVYVRGKRIRMTKAEHTKHVKEIQAKAKDADA